MFKEFKDFLLLYKSLKKIPGIIIAQIMKQGIAKQHIHIMWLSVKYVYVISALIYFLPAISLNKYLS